MKLLLVLASVAIVGANILVDFDRDNAVDRNFAGKVVLVTGSTAGIGKSIVKLFAVLGAQTVVTGRKAETVKQVAQEVEQLSPKKLKPLGVAADLTVEKDVQRLVNETITKFGRIDILVNNAGAGSATDITEKDFMKKFDDMLAIDVRATVYVNHLTVPYLLKSNGSIIHISSIDSLIPSPGGMAYSMAKIALNMMTRCLAIELGPRVRVNTISPGLIDTNFRKTSPDEEKKLQEQTAKVTPLKRVGKGVDIARAVAFLTSRDASFITGANLVVDGGLMYTAAALN